MVTTAAFLGAWGVLPNTSERRNIIQCGMAVTDHTVVADTDFIEQYAVLSSSSASGPAYHEPINLDALTLADDDEFHVTFQTKITNWSHASAGPQPCVVCEETRHTFSSGYGKSFWLGADDADTMLHLTINDGTNTVTGADLMTYALGTVYTLRMTVKRVSSTSAELSLWLWTGGTWVQQGSTASGTLTWANFGTLKSIAVGSPMTFAKGDNGTVKFSRVIASINVIPAGTMVCDHEVLPSSDGAAPDDDWVDSGGGGTVYTSVDDALGSESDADYMTSSSTASEMVQELNFTDVSGISDTIRGVVITAGVITVPATAAGTAYMATRLSGTTSTYLDAYYGDSSWDTSGNVEAEDTSRFFEKDPNGTEWTQTNVNSATYLFKKGATAGLEEWRIGSLILQVLHGDTWTAATTTTHLLTLTGVGT